MCMTPSDFFVRRTGALYFDINLVKKYEASVLLYMKGILQWNDELTQVFNLELQKAIEDVNEINK